MTKNLTAVLIVLQIIFQPTISFAQSDEAPSESYKVYESMREVGVDMFLDFMKRNQNAGLVRTSALLSACSKDGLAKAVEAKIVDRDFKNLLADYIVQGKVKQKEAILPTQAVANAMLVGYQFGYRAAIDITPASTKNALCNAAVDMANELLRK